MEVRNRDADTGRGDVAVVTVIRHANRLVVVTVMWRDLL
jgi:hypothetical protein